MKKLLLACVLFLSACAGSIQPNSNPRPGFQVCINNESWHRLDVRTAQGLQDVKFGPVEAGRTECKVFTAAPDGVRVHLRQFASSNAMEFGPFQVPVGSTLELRAQNHLPFTGVMLRHPRR
jgi:hypothetical protein